MIRIIFRLLRQGVSDLSLHPWAQLATLGAVTLIAFLSGLFLMALTTFDKQLGMIRGEIVFQVYWHPGMEISQVQEQWQSYAHLPDFQYVETFTPEEALRELGGRLGRSSGSLEQEFPFLAEKSPLPATALIAFSPEISEPAKWIAETTSFFQSQPGVYRVATTPLRDELGLAWRKISHLVMWPSVGFLILALGLIVGSTMRLLLMAKAHEIEILQMIGAFNWYIRTPLVVSGCLLGAGGGLMALGLLWLLHSQLRDALNFPPLLMQIHFPPWPMAVALVLVPAAMAAGASWLAVRRR